MIVYCLEKGKANIATSSDSDTREKRKKLCQKQHNRQPFDRKFFWRLAARLALSNHLRRKFFEPQPPRLRLGCWFQGKNLPDHLWNVPMKYRFMKKDKSRGHNVVQIYENTTIYLSFDCVS